MADNEETESTENVALDPEEELIARHRREKKDLQGSILLLQLKFSCMH